MMKRSKSNSGFTLIELIVAVAIVSVLFVLVMWSVVVMSRSSQAGDNLYMAQRNNRILLSDASVWLRQARMATMTLSGAAQPFTTAVSAAPPANATVYAYPVVEFEVPVGFDAGAERTVYSGDSNADTFCPPGHELASVVPCRIRIRRSSDSGYVEVEYVRAGEIVAKRTWLACDEESPEVDDTGVPLPGLSLYFYPVAAPHASVTVMVSNTYGQTGNLENPPVGIVNKLKIMPRN